MAREREILDLLRSRYSQVNPGNGPRYAIAEHVKSSAGFDARRQADMIVMDLWPGDARGSRLELIGHEVKCSRADWLTEMRDPDKAEAFKRYCHRWYLVAADSSIVKPGELPDGWGLIVRGDTGALRARVKAPLLTPEPLPYTVLAPLLRATQNVGRSQGREEFIEYVPLKPCLDCGGLARPRPDGKWQHVDSGLVACTFPEGDWRRGYRSYFRARV